MSLKKHYDKLYLNAVSEINSDAYVVDHLIDSESDDRLGITLLLRPPKNIKEEIQYFLDELKGIEPNQYYYENSDIHITILSIISCYSGFELENIQIETYKEIIENILNKRKQTRIQFKGVTASNSCIMIQGFMNNDVINDIRNELRSSFKNSTLEHSIDKRYAIQAAHTTVVRFKSNFQNKTQFLEVIEKFRNHDFGTFEVDNMELVLNDWYQRKDKVKKLFDFKLL